ncbi:lycopene cyclase family protein [Halomonas cibimaris]|uniref:Lycopene cyclase family protein n=1 Tax=Halomonas cibimaris TaxID=657012 RepID=A0ABP7L963_9GAMM
MNSADTDVAILGAGLAGLSIAAWLATTTSSQAPAPQVHILDARREDTQDRTWCFWDQQPHPFRQAISHRWPRWQVRHAGQTVEREDGRHGYAMITATDFRRSAYAALAEREEFTMIRGVAVDAVTSSDSALDVATSSGRLRARAVIDTRPPPSTALVAHGGVWQVFHGLEIAAPDHGYPPSTARLMDFQPASSGIHFIYVLPLGAHRLLVEWTCFHADRAHEDCQALLNQHATPPALGEWLDKRLRPGWSVTRHETGCLPMMPVLPPRRGPRYLSAGIRGGWMRPATGYMFASCQQGAADVARQLRQAHASGRWNLVAPRIRPSSLQWMDKVFLHAIRRHPEQAPDWFMRLFQGSSAAQQRRFLGDQPRLSDLFAIMRALPPGPFLRAAFTPTHSA